MIGENSGWGERAILALVLGAVVVATALLGNAAYEYYLGRPSALPSTSQASAPTTASKVQPSSAKVTKKGTLLKSVNLTLDRLADMLPESPEGAQPALVRQLAQHPADKAAPILLSFVRQERAHQGALLEAVVQLKRSGAEGAKALVALYPKLDKSRQDLVVQAFEVYAHPADKQLLAQLTVAEADPYRARWLALRQEGGKVAR